MTAFQLMAVAVAAFIAYLLVCAKDSYIATRESSPPVSPGWNDPDTPPTLPGRFISRVVGKPSTESASTYWNGWKWCYIDGYECYEQHREWKPLEDVAQ